MGLFDKKYCDVCGEKIGLLGNRKLEDGNLCKDCAAKLSPFFSERKFSTVEEIKQQLAYREENQRQIASFRATRIMGDRMKVMVDELGKRFVVTSSSDILKANPDIIPLSDVISCNLDLQVDDTELRRRMPRERKAVIIRRDSVIPITSILRFQSNILGSARFVSV